MVAPAIGWALAILACVLIILAAVGLAALLIDGLSPLVTFVQ